MAKESGPTPDDIQSSSDIRSILLKSKAEGASCALGLTGEREAVLLVHKKTKPRALLGGLKADASKIKLNVQGATLRFGIVEVDPDVDSTLATFRVNKDVPGTFEPLFKARLKKSGFLKVQFVVDETLNQEPEEAVEGAGPPPAAAPAQAAEPALDAAALARALAALIKQIPQSAGDDAERKTALTKLAVDTNTHLKANDLAAASASITELRDLLEQRPSAGAEAPAAPAALDPAAMRQSLGDLIRQIGGVAGASADFRKELTTYAEEANGALKGQDLATALQALAMLQSKIESGPPEPEPGPDPFASQLSKVRVAFIADQRRAVAAIASLSASIHAMFAEDEDQGSNLAAAEATLSELGDALQGDLNDQLDAIVSEADSTRRQPLIDAARQSVQRMTSLISSNPIMAALDGNEVQPEMTVSATMMTRLQAISAALG